MNILDNTILSSRCTIIPDNYILIGDNIFSYEIRAISVVFFPKIYVFMRKEKFVTELYKSVLYHTNFSIKKDACIYNSFDYSIEQSYRISDLGLTIVLKRKI